METKEVKINGKRYKVLVAKTAKERERGLMDVEEMDDNEGMLFIHPEVEDVAYWMHNCTLKLDIIFIDEDCEVTSVQKGEPEDETYLEGYGVKYVLELNQGSGVEEGDILDLDPDEEIEMEPGKLYIIGSDGTPQAEIEGGERIFSRISTRVILRKAKRAYESKKDSDYRALGRYVFNEMKAQDDRDPQYVEKK